MRTASCQPFVFRWPPLGVDRILDTRLWKHYLPQTSFAGGKYNFDLSVKNLDHIITRLHLICIFILIGYLEHIRKYATAFCDKRYYSPCRAIDLNWHETVTTDYLRNVGCAYRTVNAGVDHIKEYRLYADSVKNKCKRNLPGSPTQLGLWLHTPPFRQVICALPWSR